jgi:hypothetical protein
VDVDLTGPISEGQILAQFTLEASAIIEIIDEVEESEFDASPNLADGQTEAPISKTLLFHGIITLDARGKPLNAEISSIEAAQDDSGRRKWDETLAVSQLLENYTEVLKGLSLPPDLFKGIAPQIPPGLFKGIAPQIPPGLFKGIAPQIPPGLFKGIAPQIPPDFFKGFAPRIPPDLFFKNFGSSQTTPDEYDSSPGEADNDAGEDDEDSGDDTKSDD